jgi:hypothetical protein
MTVVSELSDKAEEQNESSVDPIQDTVSSIKTFDILRKLKCFTMENNTEIFHWCQKLFE